MYIIIDLHSIMYLLIPPVALHHLIVFTSFTFHNVSINSPQDYLYMIAARIFTFHNVSINSLFLNKSLCESFNLHSIMYLLIRSPYESAYMYSR